MTCNGCKTSVAQYIGGLATVDSVTIDLEKGQAIIESNALVSLATLKKVLPKKYKIHQEDIAAANTPLNPAEGTSVNQQNKLKQLYPLLLILLYLTVSSNLLHLNAWNLQAVMLDFMGLFYIVFSFFKILDLKGFPESFRMYDPLAKKIPFYAWVYPFIETALGLMFLMRYQLQWALIVTIIILGVTTLGVFKTLLDKKTIRCACLGTALKLPMTEATIIENVLMIVMSIVILLGT